jgi:hypothetical protein
MNEFEQWLRKAMADGGIIRPEPEPIIKTCQRSHVESLGTWHDYARRFRAALQIGEQLRQRNSIPDELWNELRVQPAGKPERTLVSVLNGWLHKANIRPVFVWQTHPRIDFGGRASLPLISALTFQVCVAVTRAEMVTCAGCQRVFTPRRGTKSGGKNYCDECRAAGVPVRDAVRAYRERKSKKEKKR